MKTLWSFVRQNYILGIVVASILWLIHLAERRREEAEHAVQELRDTQANMGAWCAIEHPYTCSETSPKE